MNTTKTDETRKGSPCAHEGCDGHYKFELPENCSCHLHPPCDACMQCGLICNKCGDPPDPSDAEPDSQRGGPYLIILPDKPRVLNKSKIDWTDHLHSSCSMIKRGVYPEGTTEAEVRKRVDGTFGGRFTHFGGGTFEFVAYTD